MKKKPAKSKSKKDDLKPEYDFDYKQGKPNRFTSGMKPGGRMVILDPEVAAVFKESKAVNDILKAVIDHLPPAARGNSGEAS